MNYRAETQWLRGNLRLSQSLPMGQFSVSGGVLHLTISWPMCGYGGQCVWIKKL